MLLGTDLYRKMFD